MSLGDNTPTKEILVLCRQLQGIYDSNKTLWTIEQLYKRIFDSPTPNQNMLTVERFTEDMNWIIGHGLISFDDDKLNIDGFSRNLLIHFFNEHREIVEN
jgi:hypothetical protein